jgi:hypothetical protein
MVKLVRGLPSKSIHSRPPIVSTKVHNTPTLRGEEVVAADRWAEAEDSRQAEAEARRQKVAEAEALHQTAA